MLIWKLNQILIFLITSELNSCTKTINYFKYINVKTNYNYSGISTLGLFGLFSSNQFPNHDIASKPTGFTLHNSTKPLTSTSFRDNDEFNNCSANKLSKFAEVTLGFMSLITSIEDFNTNPSP